MNISGQTLELIFVVSDDSEADAVMAHLRHATTGESPLSLTELVVDEALGAVSNEKVITAILVFALHITEGVLGAMVYDLLKAYPGIACVAGETPVIQDDLNDLPALDAKLRNASQPSPAAPTVGSGEA